MNLLAELKRRNVIRAAGLYLVGAWLLVQVASTVFPVFHVPDWALRALIVVLSIGLLPALVIAWVFQNGVQNGVTERGQVHFNRAVIEQLKSI